MLVYIWKQHFKSLVSIFSQVTQIKGSAAIFVDFLSFLLIRNDKNEITVIVIIVQDRLILCRTRSAHSAKTFLFFPLRSPPSPTTFFFNFFEQIKCASCFYDQ